MTEPPTAVPLPRHPSAVEDFALLVGPDVLAQALVREALGHPLVVEARVFDDYLLEDSGAGEEAGGARRSLGISVRYQARNRTLNETTLPRCGAPF